MKITIGPKITPGADTRVSDADHLYGEGWYAERTEQGFELSWDGGELVTKDVVVAISEEEFERLRNDPSSFAEISLAHDPYRDPRGGASAPQAEED